MQRFRSLQFRIAATFAIGALLVIGIVGVATHVGISRALISGEEDAAVQESLIRIRGIVSSLSQYTADQRTEFGCRLPVLSPFMEAMAHDGRTPWCRASIRAWSVESVPPGVIEAVQRGDVVLGRTTDPIHAVVFGTPVLVGEEGEDASSPFELYFFYSLEDVDQTLSLLRRVLVPVGVLTMLLSAVAGYRLAARLSRPLRLTADAAHRVAEGDLTTRLDVTEGDELSRLSRSFNEMAEALEERIRRERRFVSDVSHELRTPLTALKTSIGFVVDRLEEFPEKFRGPMELADEEVRSLQRLVDDLLELSRMEAGTVQVSAEEVDLVAFAAQLARRRAPDTDVRITGPESLVVHTDKMRLERIVGNLLENAAFHGGDNGVEITVQNYEGDAWITVGDKGPGMDPEQIKTIFNRFWRGDVSRRRDGRVGAGLGLAIARENATLIGADIGVESRPGEGSRFGVRVPDLES
jgi:two-component system, OmpR family, sensor histidine kinase MtrB